MGKRDFSQRVLGSGSGVGEGEPDVSPKVWIERSVGNMVYWEEESYFEQRI